MPYLLHYVGSAAFDMLCDRLSPEDPYVQPFDSLITILEEFYDPVPLEISENYIFHQRRQEESETVQQFLAALHKLSIHCNFGQYHKTALRNQLVFGLRNKKAQTRLLEKKELTLDEAINVAVTMELTEKGSEQMSATGQNQNLARIEYIKAGKKPVTKNYAPKNTKYQAGKSRGKSLGPSGHDKNSHHIKCYRCGKPHLASKCTINRDVRCNGCGKQGHIRAVCFSNKETMTPLSYVEEINHIEHTSFRDKFVRTLEVNGQYIEFEIDTSAAVTIMSEYDTCTYFKNVTVKHTDVRLVSYCSIELQCIGYIVVQVKYKELVKFLNIYIVRGKRKPLLGREWIRQLFTEADCLHCVVPLHEITVGHESRLQKILHKFISECSPTMSAMTGVQAKLTLKPNSSPVFMRARVVPFKMIPLVEQELDNLEKSGVIEK